MKKYMHIFLCVLVLTSGCAKKVTKTSKTKEFPKKASYKKSSFDENLEAFALDDDTLHNFAHDQSKNSSENNSTQKTDSTKTEPIFEWENTNVDQSKEDFKTVYFGFDKYDIDKDQTVSLQADIIYAKKMIDLGKVIVIEGHACDSAGSAIYNMTLSEQRAKFIATKFMDASIDKSNFKIAARGQEMPVLKGGNRREQSVNRRVEVYAIDNK